MSVNVRPLQQYALCMKISRLWVRDIYNNTANKFYVSVIILLTWGKHFNTASLHKEGIL